MVDFEQDGRPDQDVDEEQTSKERQEQPTTSAKETPPNEKDTAGDDEAEGKSKRRRKRKRKTNKGEEAATTKDPAGSSESTTDPVASSVSDEVNRTVYMEGIPFTCTPDDVRAFLADNGGLNHLVDLRLPVWQDSGRLRGYGHVVLSTAQDYETALAMNGKHYMGNRYISLRPAQAPKSNTPASMAAVDHSNPSKTLMLANLSYTATEDDIAQAIEPYLTKGGIADGGIRVVRHSHTGRSKGIGYVEFVELKSAQHVMQQHTNHSPLVICGRPCRLDYDHGRIRGSFRTANGQLWHKEHKQQQQYDASSSRGNDKTFKKPRASMD